MSLFIYDARKETQLPKLNPPNCAERPVTSQRIESKRLGIVQIKTLLDPEADNPGRVELEPETLERLTYRRSNEQSR